MTRTARMVDPGTIWVQACETVRVRVGERNFAAWIAPLRCTWAEGEIALEAPDRLTRDLVGRHFAGVIAEAVAAVAGRPCPIRLDLPAPPPLLPIRTTPPLPDHTFETFMVGQSNTRAFGAAQALARQDTTAPVFLHGPAGVGKTHLLHAIAHVLEARRLAVACLPAARLIEGLVDAIREDREGRFWRELRALDALLLDDLHSLAGQEQVQAQLIDGLVAWAEDGRALALASDRAPAAIPELAARVREGFRNGTIAGIAPPEPRLRLELVHYKARSLGLVLDAGLATRLAAAVSGNVRRLEGALRSLLAHAQLRGRAVDAALVLEVLPALARTPAAPLAVERIVEATARAFGVAPRSLRGLSRRQELALPRHVAMYLARKLCRRPPVEIAREFGRNPATLLNGCRSVATKLGVDRQLNALVAELERRLVGDRV
ncbi:MAG: AAA family ATPase [Deltaproteobacteria bacterium]|nr:MAG: AAA family ATPase [Deltaproteobacteria bacterium]